jgi:hypothetical protein
MNFSLLNKGFFLLLILSLALLTGARAGTLVELPQADNAENSEDNLECILKVLREFDERRNDTPLPEITHLYDHIQPGVDRNIDINTLLLQYFNLKDINDKETNVTFKPREMINECKLNLDPALARCKAAYGNSLMCEQVEYGDDNFPKAPFVTPKCPAGYQRYGCCKCVRMCNYTESIDADVAALEDPKNERAWTKVNYCVKRKALRSEVKRLNGQERMEIGLSVNDYEILEEKEGEYVYVRNCPKDYKRVGNTMCVALCPLGWPDLGNKCLKQGQLVFFPFVWQPGDQKVVPKP